MVYNFSHIKTKKMKLFKKPPKQLLLNLSYGVALAILIVLTYKKQSNAYHDFPLYFAIRLAVLNAIKGILADYLKKEK